MYLIRCVLNYTIPAKEKLDKMDLSGVFAVAKAHSLTAIAAYALESAGIYNDCFEEEKYRAIRKDIILSTEYKVVIDEFEKAGIWYVPLKGIVIKDIYPQIGMRQMSYIDILFDSNKANTVRRIMQNKGYITKLFGSGCHDVYYSPPICSIEMHRSLMDPMYGWKLYKYYTNIRYKLIKNSVDSFGYHFGLLDYYIYFIAHSYRHYDTGGTGLRTIVDIYLYYKCYQGIMDMKYIESECKKLGIATFERKLRELSMHLLGGCKLTAEKQQLFDYIVFSGTYGTVQNSVKNKLKKSNTSSFAKLNFIKNRLFVPIRKSDPQYKIYAARYKWFYKSKVRIPLLFFYRIGAALTSRKGRAKAELRAIVKAK